MAEIGPEPSPWELSRGLDRIEKSIAVFAQGALTTQIFAVEKAALVAVDVAQAREIGELKATRVNDQEKLDQFKKDIEDQKSRNRLFVYGLIGGPIAAAVIGFVIAGGLNRA